MAASMLNLIYGQSVPHVGPQYAGAVGAGR